MWLVIKLFNFVQNYDINICVYFLLLSLTNTNIFRFQNKHYEVIIII